MELNVRYRFSELQVAPELIFYLEKQVRQLAHQMGDIREVDLQLGELTTVRPAKPYFIKLQITATSGRTTSYQSGDNLFVLARDAFSALRESKEAQLANKAQLANNLLASRKAPLSSTGSVNANLN